MKQIVIPNAHIEQIAWTDARRIVIVILRSRCRYFTRVDPYCDGAQVVSGVVKRGMHASAKKPSLHLLVGGESSEIDRRGVDLCERNCSGHQTAVIAPIKANPRTGSPRLVLQVRGLVEAFVVVDAEGGAALSNGGAESAGLRRKESRGHAGHHHQRGKP